jgi:hypothetical protein
MKGFEHMTEDEVLQKYGRKSTLGTPGASGKPQNGQTDAGTGKVPRSKFGAVKTAVGGYNFDSKREANRYSQLKSMEDAGLIADLWLQPKYPVYVPEKDGGNVFICDYIADFRYNQAGASVIEDVKSRATATAVYKLKKRLVEAIYGVSIIEV